jgi:hypothetical protein
VLYTPISTQIGTPKLYTRGPAATRFAAFRLDARSARRCCLDNILLQCTLTLGRFSHACSKICDIVRPSYAPSASSLTVSKCNILVEGESGFEVSEGACNPCILGGASGA